MKVHNASNHMQTSGGSPSHSEELAVLQAEVKAMAERNGKGMNLGLKQVNAVLRL